MKRYLLSLVFLLLSTMATEAVVNRQCDYTVGSTTTATGFSNCNEEFADLSTKAFAIASVTGTDTIIGTSSPTVTTLTEGQMVVFTAAGTSTGAVTFKLDSTSTLNVYQQDGTTALGAGDLVSGTRYILSYKSSTTRWILMGQSGSSGAAPAGAQYLTLALSSSLSAERTFATGSTLSCTDGGANGAYTCGVATNGVGNAQLRQGAALSVIGVTGSSTANVADIAGTANQVLRVNGAGTALAFGQVDLSSSAAVTGALVATSFPALTGDVTTSGGSLATTIAANSVALTTDTTGDYVVGVADGTGIDGTASGEGSTYTPTLDLTEINSTTFGSGTFTTLTFDAGATDPVFTMASPATATMSGGGTSPIFALDDQGSLQLLEEDAGGSNYIAFQAPAAITSNVTCTLEDDSNPIPDSCVGDGSDDDIPDAGEVDDTALAAGAVDGGNLGEIADASITADDLADNAVAQAEIGDDAVGINEIDLVDGDTPANGECLIYSTSAGGSVEAITCPGAGGGDSVTVNGSAMVDPDFDDATPAAAGSGVNVKWQYSAPNLSAYVQESSETQRGVIEQATTAEAETGTDTARAVTPAGLLAAHSGKHTIYVPAAAMIAETTTGCAAGTTESTTNQVMYKTLDCDASTDEGAQFMVGMPKSSDEGTITFRVDWTAASGSGDVIWLLSCLARSNDDAIDTAFGTEISVTDTLLATGDVHQSAETSAVTPGGTWAEGDNLWCRVQRDANAAGDTIAADVKLLGVRALYSINAFTDD